MLLKTEYMIEEIPHSEHPFPQAKRENWLCLNGRWQFCKTDGQNTLYDGEIIVPFSPETLLSGVTTEETPFVLKSGEKLIYQRKFTLSPNLLLGTTLLHFGAVDSECRVFINGKDVGGHKGGFTAFTLDVTGFVKEGENEICVHCIDEGTRNSGARGKQSDKRGGIWYTAQSGIWQTVWIESMPKNHIKNLKITPLPLVDGENPRVRISADNGKEEISITVYDDEKQIIKQTFVGETELSYPFALWSPENPKLYPFLLENGDGDKVTSYFAVRTFGQRKDERGIMRLLLNNKPYFFNGVLDQGYWTDGMLTYPTDQAAFNELKMLKDMGFNTVRKHIKIEPMRWYYHCDRLGLLVWQDFVNGGAEYKFTHVAMFPFLGFKHRDNDYKYFARESVEGREEFAKSVDETLTQLYNCPCIALWVIFNEGWGQFDSAQWTEYVRGKDNSRLIDSVSGWHDQGEKNTTMKSLHIYYTPLKVPKDKRPVVLSEFGGYSMKTPAHVFDENKEFGYKTFDTQEKLVAAIEKLYLVKVLPLIKKGLCGAIYTQVSDVEEEINGLVTYDRKVIKIPVEKMAEINEKIQIEADKIQG